MSNESRSQTIRQKIFLLLNDKEMTAREISQAIGIREREVYEHLPHIALSAMAQKRKLVVLPFRCMSCGYVFEERKRFHPTKPLPSVQEDTPRDAYLSSCLANARANVDPLARTLSSSRAFQPERMFLTNPLGIRGK